MKRLDESVQKQVDQLIERGNGHSEQEQHLEALHCFCDALELLPDPLEKQNETMWLLASIGDVLFHLSSYEKAIDALSNAIKYGGLGNPFIHLRLGQSHFELDSHEKAADELTRAYMSEGEEIFKDEPSKYFEFLKTELKMPSGDNADL